MRLVLFGSVSVLVGGVLVLLGVLHLFLPTLARALEDSRLLELDRRSVVMASLMYGAGGVVFVLAGVGSIRKRRWVPSVMLTVSWSWLLGGLCFFLLTWLMLDDAFASRLSDELEPPPPELLRFVKTAILAVIAAFGLLLPALFIWVYNDVEIRQTCERHDPTPGWSDHCPAPVLGLSLGFGAAGAFALPMALYAVIPWFGWLVTGWPAGLMMIGFGIVSAYLARETFRLTRRGWWGSMVVVAVTGLSTVVTFLFVEPEALFQAMRYPEQQVQLLGRSGELILVWGVGVATVLTLVYMVRIRRHFESGSRSP